MVTHHRDSPLHLPLVIIILARSWVLRLGPPLLSILLSLHKGSISHLSLKVPVSLNSNIPLLCCRRRRHSGLKVLNIPLKLWDSLEVEGRFLLAFLDPDWLIWPHQLTGG